MERVNHLRFQIALCVIIRNALNVDIIDNLELKVISCTHGSKSSGQSIRGLKLEAALKNGHFDKYVGCVLL